MGKMQLALREMRLSFTQTKTMIVLAVVSLVCAASGPFGTQDTLTVLARIAYWGVVVVSTYGFGVFLHFVLAPEDHRTTLAKRVIACGVAAAANGGTVAQMNALTAADGALEGQIAVVSNGNSGSICLAMYTGVHGSGGSWKILATPGSTISA
ncbi:MAG: hypothetical protein EBU18_13385 [Rhodobacteraceae bacterium]|nr:hypothetical protein [Paracoccaceae bacterium]